MMDHLSPQRIGFLLFLVCSMLLLPFSAVAQGTPPLIPHPVKNYRACLLCHETGLAQAPQIPADHEGRTNVICQDCHLPSDNPQAVSEPGSSGAGANPIPHALEGFESCTDCHSASGEVSIQLGGPTQIPHTLIGRENCLACHETGVGGATQIPDDHVGRPSDVCQACHQPSLQETSTSPDVPIEPVPTPIAYPRPEGVDTCVECHATLEGNNAEITDHWQRSIHAEHDVICADCHGGDPSAETIDGAMSPEAGYIGVPAKMDIPALCASCHADVTLMRQYDLPTDQYAKYQESVHGIRLARGDTNVTTCFDCHGEHLTLKANDPASTTYPANVPALCAGCHSDPEVMAAYGIPTDQYELYRESVHGHALLDNQDFRAPNCATCHGTHGAAPPGVDEIANVCGSCHSATEDHYLESPHADAVGGPKCITCHSRHDVSVPDESLFLTDETHHCGSCHPADSEPAGVAQSLYDDITTASGHYREAEESIESARKLGMLVTSQESQLLEANTSLVTARAVQHTLDMETIDEMTGKSVELSEAAKQGAEDAISESIFRRQAMVIAVIAILLVIVALYLVKRHLDAQLEDVD